MNPVLRRELVERWRGRRAVLTLTVFLGVLAALLYALYAVAQAVLRNRLGFDQGFDAATTAPSLGRFLFDWFATFVLTLVLFVGPGYAAAQLTGERERRTLPLLQITLLSPLQIALGKLWASVAWLTLLVTASVPLAAATLFLGGVGIGDVLRTLAVLLAVATGVAGLALGISSLVRRTSTAVVLTYGLVLALVLGTLAVAAVEFAIRSRDDVEGTTLALYANPLFGLADAAGSDQAFSGFDLPSALGVLSQALPDRSVGVQESVVIGPGPGPVPLPEPIGRPAPAPRDDPVWLQVGGLYLLFAAAGVAVATHQLRIGAGVLPRRPARPGSAVPSAGSPAAGSGGLPASGGAGSSAAVSGGTPAPGVPGSRAAEGTAGPAARGGGG
jgi:ABC-2 type transport system permease protein